MIRSRHFRTSSRAPMSPCIDSHINAMRSSPCFLKIARHFARPLSHLERWPFWVAPLPRRIPPWRVTARVIRRRRPRPPSLGFLAAPRTPVPQRTRARRPIPARRPILARQPIPVLRRMRTPLRTPAARVSRDNPAATACAASASCDPVNGPRGTRRICADEVARRRVATG